MVGIDCKKKLIFVNYMILLSEEIFEIFAYCVHNRRYIEDVWTQICVLVLNFANAFKITKFA